MLLERDKRLERGETVVVNLRPETEVETEFVRFDRPRVVRVLERIAADLDDLSRLPNDAHADKESNPRDARTRHRHEFAEPPREKAILSSVAPPHPGMHPRTRFIGSSRLCSQFATFRRKLTNGQLAVGRTA